MAKEKITGQGGAGRGQGRHPRLEDPKRLTVQVEGVLLDKLDAWCIEHPAEMKKGGTKPTPRSDVVAESLERRLRNFVPHSETLELIEQKKEISA